MADLPAPLVEHLTTLLGREEIASFFAARTRSAVRVNTLKTSAAELRRRLHALDIATEPVPFCGDALFVDDPQERPVGNLWEHQAGHLFSQDASSLLPVLALDPQPGERVLDLCAAPGGKTGHIAQLMQNRGLVVANEPNKGRLNNMATNLDRMGVLNVASTQADAVRRRLPLAFDRVLVDAPCTNLGHAHTDKRAQWAFRPELVPLQVGLQRGLLTTAFHACRPGGTIVYSTCTLDPRENEGAASWFADNYAVEIEPVDVGVKGRGPLEMEELALRDDVDRTLRVHPGDADADGFFVARFRKHEDADAAPRDDEWMRPWTGRPNAVAPAPDDALGTVVAHYGLDDALDHDAHAVSTGTKWFLTTVPDLDRVLAMGPKRLGTYLATPEARGPRLGFDAATLLGRHAERRIQIPRADARRWIAGESVPAPGTEAWSIVTCEDEPLGCGRDFGKEMPSFVPKQRRVPGQGRFVGFLA